MENVSMTATVADLKDLIAEKTNVLPTRQKLLNLRFKGNNDNFRKIILILGAMKEKVSHGDFLIF